MARKIRWTYTASKDLEEIAEFIAKDSPFYAAAVVREIRDASRALTRFAKRGRVVPELNNPEIREIFVRDYRMIYKVTKNNIDILTLIHFSRDFFKTWRQKENS